MHTLAYHLFYGVGGKVDKTRAIALFKAAASQGSAASQNNLGWAYYEGKDVPQSLSDAIYWTEAPIARLKPVGKGDEVRLGYWSHRRRWEDIGDMGGVVLPLDEALEFIANEGVFWTWT